MIANPSADALSTEKAGVRLIYGKVYKNSNGELFRCVTPQFLPGYGGGEERLRNAKTGWTFRAHGVRILPDGTIDWDYTTGGYFEERRRENGG